MKPAPAWIGALSAVLLSVPAGAAAWLCVTRGLPVFASAAAGFACSALCCRVLFGPSPARIWIAFFAAAVFGCIGLRLGYASLIQQENAVYGCTYAEALAILRQVVSSPVNRAGILTDHLSAFLGLILALVLALLSLRESRKP